MPSSYDEKQSSPSWAPNLASTAVSFCLGAAMVLAYQNFRTGAVPTEWHELAASELRGVTLTEEAQHSDIAMPEGAMTGRIRFIPPDATDPGVAMGYQIHVSEPKLDTSRIPDKYRQVPVVDNLRRTVAPVDQVVYEGVVQATLKDADGKVLARLNGPSQAIASGKDNFLQGFTMQAVTSEDARSATTIEVNLLLTRCDTCTVN